VGFNLIGFDIPVLSGYMAPGAINQISVCDMLEKIHKQHGFRVGLGNIAEATLGVGKSADGLQAIEWFKQGKFDQILEYCEQDVKVTKEIWEFGKNNGFVYFTPKGAVEKKQLKVNW
jgi:DEAD/DEAH box helicase domain-containing protein